jgi:hypothetical protein
MNRNHWSGWDEAQLAAMRAGRRVHASRPGRGPLPHTLVPDVTEDARRVLDASPQPVVAAWGDGPAYPAHWLPELRAAQTPAEWMDDNRPDTITQRNGTAPHDAPAAEAYPAEWLRGLNIGEPPSGGLSSEGFLNRRDAA